MENDKLNTKLEDCYNLIVILNYLFKQSHRSSTNLIKRFTQCSYKNFQPSLFWHKTKGKKYTCLLVKEISEPSNGDENQSNMIFLYQQSKIQSLMKNRDLSQNVKLKLIFRF